MRTCWYFLSLIPLPLNELYNSFLSSNFFFRFFRTENIFIEYKKIEFEWIRNLKKIYPLVFTFGNRRSYMNSLLIAYKNNVWCLSMVRIGCQCLFYFCVCAIFFIFFLFFFFFAESTTSWGIEVNLSLFTIKWEVFYRFITRGGFFQPYLAINLTSWVQFWGIFGFYLISLCLLELYAAKYLREINTSIFKSR